MPIFRHGQVAEIDKIFWVLRRQWSSQRSGSSRHSRTSVPLDQWLLFKPGEQHHLLADGSCSSCLEFPRTAIRHAAINDAAPYALACSTDPLKSRAKYGN